MNPFIGFFGSQDHDEDGTVKRSNKDVLEINEITGDASVSSHSPKLGNM